RTYGKILVKVVDGKVTAVTPQVIDPIGVQTTKTEVLAGSMCNASTACPAATPAWTCSSTTAAMGVCKRDITDCSGATPANACPPGFTCDTAGKFPKRQCTKVVVANDPVADAMIKPWKANLAAKFDVKVGTTTALLNRGSYACPAGITCVNNPTYLE